MALRLLVLSDTRTHTGKDSVYPMMRHAFMNEATRSVYFADRAEPGNAWLFQTFDPAGNELVVKQANENWSFETSGNYPLRTLNRQDVDAVWLRLDHPVTDDFLHYLPTVFDGIPILNNPAGLIRTATKSFLVELSESLGTYMPEIAICRTTADVSAFRARHSDIVLKKTHSYGGQGVARVRVTEESDLKNDDDITGFLDSGSVLAMPYLNYPDQSDNRLIVMNGQFIGAVQRKAAPGGWLCNITSGGSTHLAEPDEREYEIIRRIDPAMQANGIPLYGIDTLVNEAGERVASEVNTLNTGTIYYLEKLTGRPLTRIVADGMVDTFMKASPSVFQK